MMRSDENIPHMGQMRNAYIILVIKPQERHAKKLLGRPVSFIL
jgi:hypothetical protein